MPKEKMKGTIQYTGRAFHQDAMEAMRGDIVRGIIELITNSDDAYVSVENGPKQKKIIIEVEHRRNQPWSVIVKDRATGMSAQTMIERITKLGGRTSGFEAGESKRGNLGRGAKDLAAFGNVTFISIKEGRYAKLVLDSNGNWELLEDRKSTKDRNKLGISKGNGTYVKLDIKENIRCPRHDTLHRKISTHFQLRDILSDSSRRIELIKVNDGTKNLLKYNYPDIPLVYEGDLEIEGYPYADACIRIYRHSTRYDDGPYDPCRPIGILVKGKRAIYENTLFSYEGNIHAGWFTGKIISHQIDELAREYDDRLEDGKKPSKDNPVPIISRRREGLNPDHPFYKALKKAAEKPLGELIDKEANRAKEIGNIEDDKTRADLDRLAKEVSRLINEELRDIEAEELTGSDDGVVPQISIVPELAYAYIGEDRTLTVAVRKDITTINSEIVVEIDPEGVADLLSQTILLKPHSRREDIVVGQIQLRPLIEGEATLVTATYGDYSANAIVEIKPPREIIEEEIEPPDTLIFERPSYSVGWKRAKKINIYAPANVVDEHGKDIKVSSSDTGIIIRTPTVKLKYNDTLDFYSAKIALEARTLDASSVIRANLDGVIATAQVKVTRKEEGPLIQISIVPQPFGSYRAIHDKEKQESGEEITVIKIAGHHPTLRPFLGEKFEGQNSPICREIIAEAVADVSARIVVEELFQIRRSSEEFDAARIYLEHNKRIRRFLPRFQKILVGDPKVAITLRELEPSPIISTKTH